MAITTQQQSNIIALTVGMFNAAPGAQFLSEFSEMFENNGESYQALADSLATTGQFQSQFAGLVTQEGRVNKILSNLGIEEGTDAYTTAKAHFDARIEQGATEAELIVESLEYLLGDDAAEEFADVQAQLNNKVEVATFYSVEEQQSATTLDGLQSVIANVTADDATVDAAKEEITGGTGDTFTLTATADNLSGTAGNDTFVGVVDGTTNANTTLSAADVLDGAGGEDALNITLQGGATANVPAADVENVETVSVRNVSAGATIVGASGFVGASEFINDRSTQTVEFTNIGTADLTVKGNDVVTNGATDFTSGATSVTDPLTLNITGGVNAGAITNQTTVGVADANGDWTSVTINSTGGTATATTAANVVGALDLAGGDTMQSLTVNADSSLTTGAIAGWDTTGATTANKGSITITGDSAVNLNALDAAVETVDASENTGGVTLTASSQTDFNLTGSTGNDRITTNAVLGTDGGIDAGEGSNDRLIHGASAHVTQTVGAEYSNFEELQVANGVTVDLDHLSANNSIDSIRLTTGGVVNDLSAAQAGNITVTTGGNSPTIGVKGASTVGQIDTVHITADDGAAATSTIALGTPVIADVEKVQLTANDNITVTALTGVDAFDSLTLDGSGTINIASGAITPSINTVVDGSAATGALTLNFGGIVGAAGTNAMSIKGGSAGDTIKTGGGAADVVNGGAGIDTIDVTKDLASSGFAVVQSDAVTSTDADLITGFVTAENDFDYNGALSNGTGAGEGIAATEVASAANIAAALATGDAANDIAFIATTDLTGAQETALDAAVAGGMTAAEADAVESALVGTGGALNGAIANLDTVLGADDSVLFQFSTDSDTMVLRVTNSDRSGTNTLTADEIELVGVFSGTADLVAGDYA